MSEAQVPGASPEVPSDADTDPLIGRTVSERFTIVAPIGSGGMGRVYKAIQAPLGRTVALKILSPGFSEAQDPSFVKRFYLEASVTSKLSHPNTITIFDHGRTDDGIFYIAMEYLEGQTLSRALHGGGALHPARVVRIAVQIARSLREAHRFGIIHRDLKPANIFLQQRSDEDEDFVKVLDFGLVKFFADRDVELTNAGTFMGSPHYIAPEQARNDNPDPRADIYSLGVLMYHMATGRVPFTADSSIAVVLKQINDTARPPRMVNAAIPEALEAVILRCLEKEREKRYPSMDGVIEALGRAGSLLGVSTTSTGTELPAITVDDSQLVREPGRRGLVAAAVAGLLVAAGIGLVLASPWEEAKPPVSVVVEPPPSEPPPVSPPHLLFLTAEPAGAEIWEGDKLLGTAPLTVERVRDTTLKLSVRARGFSDGELVKSLGGASSTSHVVLKKGQPKGAVRQPPATGVPAPTPPAGYKEDPY